MNRLRRLVLVAATTILCTYGAVVALAWAFQGSFIYPAPQAIAAIPAGYEEATLETSDGLSLRAAFSAPRAGQSVVVFFHGNGDNLPGAATAMGEVQQAGYGVLLVEYRGYGGNAGEPSEEGFYRDGRAALAWLKAQGYQGQDIVLAGNSIGSGTAVQMASEVDARALILVSPLTSVPDVAAEQAKFLPVRLLLRDQFANADKIGNLAMPILLQHGTGDRVVPFSHAEKLAGLAKNVSLEDYPGVGHELAYLPAPQDAQIAWLAKLAE
ncbi:alpha/beta hydrolase [Pontixanthobacter aquaemixtae]|uniref:Alpha/beta fold hydrolase n=1 Tax=Pontixanthobacter aquaemixtae TaxID=1958940 RepID=A0A844ZUG5_9SPHN|nr:alpha/beta hydrolase [Pontixanthobacter aquaemixtae]MXO91525.1 alpha/beta fold hydrolase [Pontixanthobacter aquaemixtae]